MTAPDLSNTPAWVQAIGSIVAILVAVGLAAWQHHQSQRLQHRMAERARHESVSSIGGLLEGLYVELWEAMNAASGGGWRDYITTRFDPDRLGRAIDALEKAPVHQIGNWRIVTAVTSAREAGFEAISLLRRLQQDGRKAWQPLSDADHDRVCAHFDAVNRAMAPVVRALAYDIYEVGPLGEWKEHLDMPEALIPKHLRPPSFAKANRRLRHQAVALGIRRPKTIGERAVAAWHWRTTLKRFHAERGAKRISPTSS